MIDVAHRFGSQEVAGLGRGYPCGVFGRALKCEQHGFFGEHVVVVAACCGCEGHANPA